MHLKVVIAFIALFLVGHARCFSQDSGNRQQQIEEHSRKAQQFLRERKPELAIPELQSVIALDPNNVDALGNLGVLLSFRGDCAKAIPHLRASLKLQPDLWKIQALLGTCEKNEGDLAAGRRDLEAAFPQLVDEKIYTKAGLELIEIYSSTGELNNAATIVDKLRQRDPTNVTILYTAYRIYSDLTSEAMISMSLVAPDSAQMHQIVAHELERQGNRLGAIAQYREALQLDPSIPGLHFELAEVLYGSSKGIDKEEAAREYKAALNVNSQDEKAECRLGEIAAHLGDLKESYAHYERAVHLQPADANAEIGLAKTLASMNQPDKAIALLEQVVRQDPTNALAHFRLSTLYRQAGRTENAKYELDQFQKYKEMKEKLKGIYKQMRLQAGQEEGADIDAAK